MHFIIITDNSFRRTKPPGGLYTAVSLLRKSLETIYGSRIIICSLAKIRACDDVLRYITRLAEATRSNPEIILGVSPRGTQALLKAAQAFAIIKGRDYITPYDVKTLAIPVWAHRIIMKGSLRLKAGSSEDAISGILQKVDVPTEDNIDFKTA